MGWFFGKKKEKEFTGPAVTDFSFLGTDMHSHLVPGVDDGSASLEDSLQFIRTLKELGYSRVITTPHVHVEFYNNAPDDLRRRFEILKEAVSAEGLDIALGLGAEYMLDEFFLRSVLPEGLLAFSDNKYVLTEVSMAGWPRQLHDCLFEIQSQGLIPIMAHPERYQYETSPDVFLKLKEKGVLMQMNLLAAVGYYGKGIKDTALEYMRLGLYDFCGTDTHHVRHLERARQLALEQPEIMHRLSTYGFKNAEL